MTIQRSLSIIFFCTLLSLAIFIIFLFFVDQEEAGAFGSIIFFSSLFFVILGFFTLFFIILKLRFLKDQEKIFEKISIGFRQAILFSLFLLSILLLRSLKNLNWWSLAIIFLFFLLLEIIFSTRRKKFIYSQEADRNSN